MMATATAKLEASEENQQFYQRYQFFKANCGYVVGERAKSAMQLARAELLLEHSNIEPEWTPDDCHDRGPIDWGWTDKEIGDFYDHEHIVECCKVGGESMCGIWDADADYRRVIEAELAAQHFSSW